MLGQIVGGWTITGIHNYRSGSTLSVSDAESTAPAIPIRPDVVSGADQIIYDGSTVDLVNGTPYLNRAAFATQPLSAQGIPTRIGTAPAILDVRGPALYTEDLGFLKRFGVGERTAEFRVDIINLFNRSGLAGPNTDLSSPNFGKIFGVGQGAAAGAAVAAGDVLNKDHGQLPTPNFQLPRETVRRVFPWELGVGSWELTLPAPH